MAVATVLASTPTVLTDVAKGATMVALGREGQERADFQDMEVQDSKASLQNLAD